MHILHRAAVWTILASTGLVPLSACGDEAGAGGGRNTLVRESAMPKERPTGDRTPGSTVPMPQARAGKPGEAPPPPRTGAVSGPYDPGKTEAPQAKPRAEGGKAVETRTLSIQSNGAEIIGTMTRPATGGRGLLVVMLHGYTGNRAELGIAATGEGLFERAARRFAEAGIPSFRFDFAGSGQSGGAWRDTTFTGQAGDTRAVIAYLRRVEGYSDTPIALLGFSQGGLVALKVAASGEAVSRVALWNPVLDPEGTYSRILGADQVRDGWKLAQAGKSETVVGSTRLAAGFFADVHNTDPIRDAATYGGPVLVVAGSRDNVAASGPSLAEKLRQGRGGPTRIVILNADHGFNASRGTGRIDKAIDDTIGFLTAGTGG